MKEWTYYFFPYMSQMPTVSLFFPSIWLKKATFSKKAKLFWFPYSFYKRMEFVKKKSYLFQLL